jgi:hypothetical protein
MITSIWRSNVTICSALIHLSGMSKHLSKTVSQTSWPKIPEPDRAGDKTKLKNHGCFFGFRFFSKSEFVFRSTKSARGTHRLRPAAFDAGGGVCPPLCGAGFGQGWPLARVAGRAAEQGALGRNDRPSRAYFTAFATGLSGC